MEQKNLVNKKEGCERKQNEKIIAELKSVVGHTGRFQCGTNPYVYEMVIASQNNIHTAVKLLEKADKLYREEVDSVDKVETITCYKCGDKTREGDAHRWYHGDQDDLICEECARKTKHTDTAYAGQYVLRGAD